MERQKDKQRNPGKPGYEKSTTKGRQIKYFGHIKRHDSLLKTLLEGLVEGRRDRGRQRYKWERNIKRWTGYSMSECTTQARNRVCWRSVAANLRYGDGTG